MSVFWWEVWQLARLLAVLLCGNKRGDITPFFLMLTITILIIYNIDTNNKPESVGNLSPINCNHMIY